MNSYDTAIVGGGAAGLSAALVLSRARRNVIVIDDGSPRNAPAAHMHGYLSRDGMPPSAFLAQGRDEVTLVNHRGPRRVDDWLQWASFVTLVVLALTEWFADLSGAAAALVSSSYVLRL